MSALFLADIFLHKKNRETIQLPPRSIILNNEEARKFIENNPEQKIVRVNLK